MIPAGISGLVKLTLQFMWAEAEKEEEGNALLLHYHLQCCILS
jgi:hypothetical protein